MVQTPFSKRSLINSEDLGNTTYHRSNYTEWNHIFSPPWYKLLFLKGVSLTPGIWVIRHHRQYSHENVLYGSFSPLTGIWVIRHSRSSTSVGKEAKCFSPLTGIWVIRLSKKRPYENVLRGFSPLTGIWVIRLCD